MNGTARFTQLPPVPGTEYASVAFMPILRSIVDGSVVSGEELCTKTWASRLGVCTIDVDDAIPRLAHLGLVEVSDGRRPRMTTFTRAQAAREVESWAELQLALIAASPQLHSASLRRMQRARNAFAASLAMGGPPNEPAHLAFFWAICEATGNFGLRLATTSAAYRVRLSAHALPHDARRTSELHDGLLTALRSQDPVFDAEYVLRAWSGAVTGSPLGW